MRRLVAARMRSERSEAAGRRPADRCWPSRGSGRSHRRRRSGCRSRCPPCIPGRACAGARADRRRPGRACMPVPSTISAPSGAESRPASPISAITPSAHEHVERPSMPVARIEDVGAADQQIGSRPPLKPSPSARRPIGASGRAGSAGAAWACRPIGGSVSSAAPSGIGARRSRASDRPRPLATGQQLVEDRHPHDQRRRRPAR